MKTLTILPLSLLLYYHATAQDSISSAVSYKHKHYKIDDSILSKNSNLSPLLLTLDTANLRYYTEAKSIPAWISDFYRDIAEEDLWLADKDALYNCCCNVEEELPYKQLIYFGRNEQMALLTYNQGSGFFSYSKVLIFRFEGKRIIDFWMGIAKEGNDSDLKNRDAIVHYLRKHINDANN
jgi:hypothetical protein